MTLKICPEHFRLLQRDHQARTRGARYMLAVERRIQGEELVKGHTGELRGQLEFEFIRYLNEPNTGSLGISGSRRP